MSLCDECKAFDDLTAQKMKELFSVEEVILLTMNLAGYLKQMSLEVNKVQAAGLKRLNLIQQRDMVSKTMGKFIITLSEDQRQFVKDAALKRLGIALAVNHETCPHEQSPNPPPPGAA